MPTITWQDRYLIDIPMIDNQHRYLLQLFNTFYHGYNTSPSKCCLSELLDNLSAYTSYHFSLEERWMEYLQYPVLNTHHKQHAYLSLLVGQIQQEYKGQEINSSIEAINMLHNMLVSHIQESDSDFGYFIQKIVRPPVVKHV